MASGEFRLRLCCGKRNRLRFLSHLEYAHAIERGIRRSGIEFSLTQGYNPRMKLAFGPALPVGTGGMREYVDVWLRRYVPTDTALDVVQSSLAEELSPSEAKYVHMKDSSLSAQCTIGVYEVLVTGGGATEELVRTALDELIDEGSVTIKQKGRTKVYDLMTCLPKEAVVRQDSQDSVSVGLSIRMGSAGSLRPEALIAEALHRHDRSAAVKSVMRLDTLVESKSGLLKRPI
ncbi:MAG: TIGR03936 family radical SAM-associated protein [Actinobacteria bacterium]|nr:TIGR03936 family radical SAM-associated protein [Actinomycetota bacterium]MCL5888284.1 TIGR03936 family radical SAM-associated protein [Actinomycetota bacterium]